MNVNRSRLFVGGTLGLLSTATAILCYRPLLILSGATNRVIATAMSAETLRQTASAVIAGYNAWTMDAIMAPRSASCIQQILPLSLGRPPMNNEEYTTYFGAFIPAFRNFKVTIKDTVIDEKERKICMWASSTAETAIGPYSNEYMLLLKCDEEGKVEWVGEFVDTSVSIGYLGRLKERIAEQASASAV